MAMLLWIVASLARLDVIIEEKSVQDKSSISLNQQICTYQKGWL